MIQWQAQAPGFRVWWTDDQQRVSLRSRVTSPSRIPSLKKNCVKSYMVRGTDILHKLLPYIQVKSLVRSKWRRLWTWLFGAINVPMLSNPEPHLPRYGGFWWLWSLCMRVSHHKPPDIYWCTRLETNQVFLCELREHPMYKAGQLRKIQAKWIAKRIRDNVAHEYAWGWPLDTNPWETALIRGHPA